MSEYKCVSYIIIITKIIVLLTLTSLVRTHGLVESAMYTLPIIIHQLLIGVAIKLCVVYLHVHVHVSTTGIWDQGLCIS